MFSGTLNGLETSFEVVLGVPEEIASGFSCDNPADADAQAPKLAKTALKTRLFMVADIANPSCGENFKKF
jgi:hypothetical protein